MKISLQNIGRRFNRDWIFRKVDYEFAAGNSYAILGANGSGKSTLLQLIAGNLSPSEGSVAITANDLPVDIENFYLHLSIAAPYLELVEDFTLQEAIDFHFRFKKLNAGFRKQDLIELLGLDGAKHKTIRNFSSGMKQRLKLLLAICADTPVLLLDEPASNLDRQGLAWYLNMIDNYTAKRLLIICSNQEEEYQFCEQQLHLANFKDFNR